MDKIHEAVQALAEAVKESPLYTDYITQRENLEQYPELKAKVYNFRRLNFEIQNNTHENDLLEKIDQIEAEYGDFLEEPLVQKFLDAELAFCRLMQEISKNVTEAIDFE